MKQVWPRPQGYTEPAEVCLSRRDRLLLSHPVAMTMLILGVISAMVGVLLGSVLRLVPEYVFFGLLSGTFLVTGLIGVVRWLREDRIAHTGADALAEVTELKAGRTQISYRRPYQLRYRYKDMSGAEHEGRARVIGTSWESFRGQPVLVRYDRERPALSAVVWNDLRDERGVPY